MAYFNYRNLDPTEFEALALDVMQRRLGCKLYRYAQGTDGGIDLCNNIKKKDIVVQCKRYQQGSFNDLYGVLKREEKPKIESLNPCPKEYYVFTSLELNPQQKEKILILFQRYMEDESYIVDGIAINDFFRDKKNHDLIARNIKLFLSFPENYEYSTAELFWLEENKLYDRLTSIFANERKDNPSIRMMDPDPNLFPKGLPEIKSDNRLAVVDKESPRAIKDMILDSWKSRNKRHILLVGEGGIGKTVAMLTLPEEEWFRQYRIPAIYVPLQRLDKREGKLDNYLEDKLGAVDYNRIIELANQRFESHPRLLLLLDGFNEIPDKFKGTTERFIRDWMEKPGVQIITTSRLGFSLENRFFKYQLQTLPIGTVESFLLSAGIEKEQLPNKNDLIWKVINVPLMLALYTRIDKVKEAADRSYVAFLLDWKKADNAAHIIWNYLQTELYRYIDKAGMSYSPMQYVTAILLVAPYVCCQMSRRIKFYIDQEEMQDFIREALSFFDGRQNIVSQQFQNLRKKYDRYSEEDLFGIKMSSVYSRILVENIAVFQEQEIYDEKGNLMYTYSLMHQNFRDALAALFISLCLPKASDSSEKTLLLDYADHYVKNYIAEFLSDKELIGIWDKHREEEPGDGHITWILMDIIGRQKNYDYRTLDFSGLDLSRINLHGLISKRLDICPLPKNKNSYIQTILPFKSILPEGHTDRVTCVSFCQNGKFLASGSTDKTVRVWDLEGSRVQVLEDLMAPITSVAISSDGKHLAGSSAESLMCIWDLDVDDVIMMDTYNSISISRLMFSQDRQYLIGVSDDGKVFLWNLDEEQCELECDASTVNSVAMSQDYSYLASNTNGKTVTWYLDNNCTDFTGMKMSNKVDRHFVDGQLSHTVVWNLKTGSSEILKGNETLYIMAFSFDRRYLAGAGERRVVVWDIEKGTRQVLKGNYGYVTSISFSPDGKYLACGSTNNLVQLWELESEKCWKIKGHSDTVTSVSFGSDGRRLASGSADRTVRIRDLEREDEDDRVLEGYIEWVNCMSLSPDERMLAVGLNDQTVRVWDLEKNTYYVLEGHSGSVRSVTFSPNGRFLASGSNDNTVRLWSLETRTCYHVLKAYIGEVLELEFSTDGRFLKTGIQTWNLIEELNESKWYEYNRLYPLPYSKGKYSVRRSYDGRVQVSNAKTGCCVKRLRMVPRINCSGVNLEKANIHEKDRVLLREAGARA